jgi:hypothetical protein
MDAAEEPDTPMLVGLMYRDKARHTRTRNWPRYGSGCGRTRRGGVTCSSRGRRARRTSWSHRFREMRAAVDEMRAHVMRLEQSKGFLMGRASSSGGRDP